MGREGTCEVPEPKKGRRMFEKEERPGPGLWGLMWTVRPPRRGSRWATTERASVKDGEHWLLKGGEG